MNSKEVRVALALYGQPRFLENIEVSRSLKTNLIEPYSTDVFCHTWWHQNADYELPTWSPIKDKFISNAPPQEKLWDLYRPVETIVSEPKSFQFSEEVLSFLDEKFTGRHQSWTHKNYSNVLSQLNSIQAVAGLVRQHISNHNKNYDFIALCRYDSVLAGIPRLRKLSNTKFYLPHNHGRFPDMVFLFGERFLSWAENIADDAQKIDVARQVFSPGPEGFKHASFISRHSYRSLKPIAMNAHAIRYPEDSIRNALFHKELRSVATRIKALRYYR